MNRFKVNFDRRDTLVVSKSLININTESTVQFLFNKLLYASCADIVFKFLSNFVKVA